jgi:hypothetical protein
MRWWEYRLARGAGHSVLDSLASTLFNKHLPDRKLEIEAEREASIARMEKARPGAGR